MGFTAERVAERWKVSRADQDAFALDSQQKAVAAWKAGKFADEVVPIDVEQVSWEGSEKTVKTVRFDRDELPRPEGDWAVELELDGLLLLTRIR